MDVSIYKGKSAYFHYCCCYHDYNADHFNYCVLVIIYFFNIEPWIEELFEQSAQMVRAWERKSTILRINNI